MTNVPSVDRSSTASSSSSPADESLGKHLSTADYPKQVKCAAVSSVLRQSDQSPSSYSKVRASDANSKNDKSGKKKRKRGSKDKNLCRKITAAELAQAQINIPFHLCQQVGHWADAYSSDGSIKPGRPSFDR